jgi:hypothetical protein
MSLKERKELESLRRAAMENPSSRLLRRNIRESKTYETARNKGYRLVLQNGLRAMAYLLSNPDPRIAEIKCACFTEREGIFASIAPDLAGELFLFKVTVRGETVFLMFLAISTLLETAEMIRDDLEGALQKVYAVFYGRRSYLAKSPTGAAIVKAVKNDERLGVSVLLNADPPKK